jgi:hypothetical protein
MSEPETGWRLWRLRAGDKIRVTEGAPIRVVKRVTPGAAYFVVETEKTYTVFDRKTGEDKDVTRTSSKTDYISAYSFVEMIERGPAPARRIKVVETAPVVPQKAVPRPELAPIEYKKTKSRKLGGTK